MAINVPMPSLPGDALLKGIDTGSNMFAKVMQSQNEKARLAQQQEQFKKTQDRLGQLAPLQRELLQEQVLAAQHKNDPMYEINNLKNMLAMFGGKGAAGVSQPDAPIPTQEAGAGLGIFSPEGLSEALQQSTQNQPQGADQSGIDWNMIKNNPLMRGFFKQKFGIDPGASSALQGPAREAMDLENLANILPGGKENPVYKNAESAYNAKQQASQDLSGIRSRQLGGLKPGERWIYGDNNEAIGKDVPLTATERNEAKGRGFFNHTFDYITRGLAPLSGEGSIRAIGNAALEYGKNPEATALVDNFLLAKQLLTSGTVKEAATLMSGKQKSTYQQLKESLDSSDIPKSIEGLIKKWALPNSAAIKADQSFKRILNEGTKAGEAAVPAYQQTYFKPETQQKTSASQESEEMITIKNKKTGVSETVTLEEARNRGVPNV